MGEPRPEKVAVVTEVRERLSSSNGALLTEYRGLKVADLANLRRAVGDAGGEYRIFKNTLVRRAASELGLADLDPLLVGPTAIAFVDGDAVAVAKSLRDFARTNPNLTIKGGLLGTTVLSAADAGALADVAPREVILAQLAGALAAPLQKMAGLLQALPRNFAYGLSALVEKRQSEAPPAPAPQAEAPQAEAPPAEAPPADAPPAEAPPAEAPPAPAPQAEAPPAPAPQAEAPPAEAPQAEAPPADTTQSEAPQSEAPQADTPAQDTPQAEEGDQ
jgi:large subunit ribosomal protein L10